MSLRQCMHKTLVRMKQGFLLVTVYYDTIQEVQSSGGGAGREDDCVCRFTLLRSHHHQPRCLGMMTLQRPLLVCLLLPMPVYMILYLHRQE